MTSGFFIRAAQPMDIPAVVSVHQSAFKGFFLTRMGPAFLRVLYRGFLNDPTGVFLVACRVASPDEAVGFVAGTTAPATFFRDQLRKHWIRYLAAAFFPLLMSPSLVIQKLWSALFYRGETLPELPNAALLSSLGVLPQLQGAGLGNQLVKSFLNVCKEKGLPAVYLTTDQSDNDKANAFYQRCGFRLAGACKRPPQRILNRYLIEL
ncbi:GNAT family N-acetyltransferase [Limnobacter litoralis]|uniref:N-acetyltransferase domain-containing protein n=1 Tax=Limnobacter litoralis TaxID=481366 RepID=A0ABQ5YM52_9BURK|nr:GNAT family N-acetyltransferase [Limnobacter litoralis]GLR25197.1 hypothetical protein GCM10007875_02850 [Limnobacter litoralis]